MTIHLRPVHEAAEADVESWALVDAADLDGDGQAELVVRKGGAAAEQKARDRLRPKRLKPRLEHHKVRLRGLGGRGVCCVPKRRRVRNRVRATSSVSSCTGVAHASG